MTQRLRRSGDGNCFSGKPYRISTGPFRAPTLYRTGKVDSCAVTTIEPLPLGSYSYLCSFGHDDKRWVDEVGGMHGGCRAVPAGMLASASSSFSLSLPTTGHGPRQAPNGQDDGCSHKTLHAAPQSAGCPACHAAARGIVQGLHRAGATRGPRVGLFADPVGAWSFGTARRILKGGWIWDSRRRGRRWRGAEMGWLGWLAWMAWVGCRGARLVSMRSHCPAAAMRRIAGLGNGLAAAVDEHYLLGIPPHRRSHKFQRPARRVVPRKCRRPAVAPIYDGF